MPGSLHGISSDKTLTIRLSWNAAAHEDLGSHVALCIYHVFRAGGGRPIIMVRSANPKP